MKTKTLTYLHNMKKIILTESEKSRILGMHKSAIHSEKKIVNEATLKDIQAILIQRGIYRRLPRQENLRMIIHWVLTHFQPSKML